MKTGVSTTPWLSLRRPRARPSSQQFERQHSPDWEGERPVLLLPASARDPADQLRVGLLDGHRVGHRQAAGLALPVTVVGAWSPSSRWPVSVRLRAFTPLYLAATSRQAGPIGGRPSGSFRRADVVAGQAAGLVRQRDHRVVPVAAAARERQRRQARPRLAGDRDAFFMGSLCHRVRVRAHASWTHAAPVDSVNRENRFATMEHGVSAAPRRVRQRGTANVPGEDPL